MRVSYQREDRVSTQTRMSHFNKRDARSRSVPNVMVVLLFNTRTSGSRFNIKTQAFVASRFNTNASLRSSTFQLKHEPASIAFQLQREPTSSAFQSGREPASSASNNRTRSASSARPTFCCTLHGQLTPRKMGVNPIMELFKGQFYS